MEELCRCAAMSNTLLGAAKPDIHLCHRLFPFLMNKYPKGAVTLFLRSRLLLVSGDINSAIYHFNCSLESQQKYKQFHHVVYWELLFAHIYLGQWDKAANYAKRLVNESNWSKCIYTYLLCILIAADTTYEEVKKMETVTVLARKVDGLRHRIAGKSIPVEKYCARKANRFIAKHTLMFAHYEFIYFWNGIDVLNGNKQIIHNIFTDLNKIWHERSCGADADDRALYFFLKAVCLRNLQQVTAAEQSLQEVLKLESKLMDFTYLPPYAIYELAILRIVEGIRDEAEALLSKARLYKDYALENKLHFLIHSAMQNLG
ncbi:hypothetical protein KIN20_025511 [Parelaphostrongylus tenuis]|uniref:Tetratricopeptide repeat protein 39B n=1 Tax=Parelaphostrongylus tenuis TaxID=148309 RepID=A0AAD5QXS7_PARTN|nr:hypothetical protein KIN20_025511 [Parelaphostrongylus tenuis]